MRTVLKTTAIAVAGLIVSAISAQAENLTNADGMTLYVFDKDAGGVSACYDDCAVNWPPYLGEVGATMDDEDWTLVPRTDGTLQWAYDGKPVYLFIKDVAAGDATGDGVGGVWHIAVDDD